MTKAFWFKLLSFLVPAGTAVGFLIWWLSPTQKVKRAAEGILAATEVRLLSTGTPAERTAHFVNLVTDPVMVELEGPFRGGSLSREELESKVRNLVDHFGICDRPTLDRIIHRIRNLPDEPVIGGLFTTAPPAV